MTLFCFHCQVRIKVLADMFRFLGSGRQFDIAGSPGLVEQHLPLSPCTIFLLTYFFAMGGHHVFLVPRRELRPVEGERDRVDLPRELERHLLVFVIHRCAGNLLGKRRHSRLAQEHRCE
jgi:hypothetical protein